MHPRYEFGDIRPWTFRPHQIHLGATLHRDEHQNEDEDAHSADPVRKAAPEQARVAHGLDVCKNRRPRRRETADDFKQRVDVVGNLAGQDEGQRADGRHDDPRQCDGDVAALLINAVVAGLLGKQKADPLAAGDDDQIRRQHSKFAVDQTDDDRGAEQQPLNSEDPAGDVANHGAVHGRTRVSRMSPISSKPVFVVTTMTESPGMK